jgi:hypothetical protein
VRGEKDYCVVLIVSSDLVRTIRVQETREFFAEQTRVQVDLGLEVSSYASEDLARGGKPLKVLTDTMQQLLRRDENWKEFYSERMNGAAVAVHRPSSLTDIYIAEREAEAFHIAGKDDLAVDRLQKLLDCGIVTSEPEKGWYLQEMARYTYAQNRVAANRLQIDAHAKNRFLLRPRTGMNVSRLAPRSEHRADAIVGWMRACGSHEALYLTVESILSDLRFGVGADRFEAALDALAAALGFSGERPDKEWKAGPDNLWAVRDGVYLLIECKSEVELTRGSINKQETGQMNNSRAWFEREYPGASVSSIMVIPTKKLSPAAGFTNPTLIMRKAGLGKLVRNVRNFFGEFRRSDLGDLSPERVDRLVDVHNLQLENILMLAETPTVSH